jgi:hypothetical protein
LVFAPGLAFRLVEQPAHLLQAVRRHFRHQVVTTEPPSSGIVLGPQPPPALASEPRTVLTEGPVSVQRAEPLILFEAAGARAWCEPARGRGGIVVATSDRGAVDDFVGRVLTSLFFELAVSAGWLGLHAAAIAVAGHGLLLPGASGSGKTTTFRAAADAGLDLLSDDLVWLREEGRAFTVHALQRGVPSEPVPAPTVDQVALAAVVCPSISASGPSHLEPLSSAEVVAVLVAESGFLSPGATAGERFRGLVRLAARVPGYRLHAGPQRHEVMPLLRSLLDG